jgi:hypothetical protein
MKDENKQAERRKINQDNINIVVALERGALIEQKSKLIWDAEWRIPRKFAEL